MSTNIYINWLKHQTKALLCMLGTTIFVTALPAVAVESDWVEYRYELIRGRGVEVCETYLSNLNSFSNGSPPMICEAKINPRFPEFRTPNWRRWSNAEIWKRRKLVVEIERLLFIDPKDFDEKSFLKNLKKNLHSQNLDVTYSEAQLSGHDGNLMTYVKYEFASCDSKDLNIQPEGRVFATLNQSQNRVSALEHRTSSVSQIAFRRPDIILYNGKPVLQYWQEGENLSLLSEDICTYRYQKKKSQ